MSKPAHLQQNLSSIQAQHDLLSNLTSQIPGVIYQYQLFPDGRSCFPYASAGLREIYELTPDQVQRDASAVFERIHPADIDKVSASIQESARTLQPWQLRYRVNLPRQGLRWLDGFARPEQLADGSVLWHGFITDSTVRVQLEHEAHASAETLRSLYVLSPFGFVLTDMQGRFIEFNQPFQAMCGYAKDELKALDYHSLTPGKYAAEDTRQLELLVSTGRYGPYEKEYQHKDGRWVPIRLNGVLTTCSDGQKYIWSIVEDITEKKRNEAQNHALMQEQQAMLNSELMGIAKVSNRIITWINSTFARMLDFDEHALIGMPPDVLYPTQGACQALRDKAYPVLSAGKTYRTKVEFKRKNGQPIWLDMSGVMLRPEKNEVMWVVLDITKDKQAERELQIAAVAFETQEGVLVTDACGQILRANQAVTRITGYSNEELLGKTPRMLKSGRHGAAFYSALWLSLEQQGTWQGEIWNKRKSGEIYPEHLSITSVHDSSGNLTNYVATLTDITTIKAAADKIETLAFYDPLTHLPNRRLLLDRIKQAMASSARAEQYGAVLFIDLDHFKTINDVGGHAEGDKLLKLVAERLKGCIREGDTVARLGGDEFVILLEGLSPDTREAAARAEMVGNKILAALDQSYGFLTYEYRGSGSVGVTLFLDHQQSGDELLRQADIAMYQAKKAGRNALRFFDPQMQKDIDTRAALESALHKAIDNQQLYLYYQIQVDNARRPVGAEALIRWLHPELGWILPQEFISLAEEGDLITLIGNWVLQAACAQLKAWQEKPLTRHLDLSVNVSARQFNQPDFTAQVEALIARYDINPQRLKLELTESMLLDNIERTIATMNELKALGLQFSLDDFGTGYSSLQYLRRLPLNQLKIDQSFVRSLDTDGHDQTIVRTIIAMAHSLNLNVIAEGVETALQQHILWHEGCVYYQGYLFSKPVPIGEFEQLLEHI
jgi:diguanylate cyclase (GGDEF)-like protein/PAS domain S-box-containing protein